MTKSRNIRYVVALLSTLVLWNGGCHQQHYIDSADGIANRIIRQRQQEALGTNSDFEIGPEDGHIKRTSDAYSFVPHPIDSSVPDSFKRRQKEEGAEQQPDNVGSTGLSHSGQSEADSPLRPFTLSDALAYAFHHARDFQTHKETLYLNALGLMTERQLWTPQVVGRVSAEYANYGQVGDFDHAMTAVAELSASQRLPYGGEVAARVVNTLMRDIGHHTTSGESGTTILSANIPLLRGSGRVAYESRYQAERDLIYAVRDFEAARRNLIVSVAGDFFDLLATKTQIDSAKTALESAQADLIRSKAYVDVDRMLQVEADRSSVQVLDTTNALASAKVRYETALDRFKIRIGMPTTEPIDAVEEELNLAMPDVTEDEATEAALRYRLDLLNARDYIDDANRAVEIAKNNFLPQLDVSGSVTMVTDPNQKNSTAYNTERTTWRSMVEMELPLDQRQERNEYRSTLINLRRAERNYEEFEDNVRIDVRRAIRNIELAKVSMEIQQKNITINTIREDRARTLMDRGLLSSNRDMIEAQQALQASKNQYATALAGYRLAILTFLRDSGVLRVDDNGHWTK